jgi:hypothetical protein
VSQPPPLDPRTLARLLHLAGARDAASWLGVPRGASPAAFGEALDRRRAWLADHPEHHAEAELIDEHEDALRAWLPMAPGAERLPDHYAELGVPPSSSFAEIHAAWRGRQEPTPAAQEAWTVLGDPILRAAYDRDRHARTVEAAPHAPFLADPATALHGLATPRSASGDLTVVGASTCDVDVAQGTLAVFPVRFEVRASAPLRVRIETSHPALRSVSDAEVTWSPGVHTLAVQVDPTALPATAETLYLRLFEPGGLVTVAVRARRTAAAGPPSWRSLLPMFLSGTVLGVGIWLGGHLLLAREPRPPTREAPLSDLPAVAACFDAAEGDATPDWVDVHLDATGRATGFVLPPPTGPAPAGPTSLDACVKRALADLTLPAPEGDAPTMVRYHRGIPSASTSVPP